MRTVVVSCAVFEDALGSRLPAETKATWLDSMLHDTPKKLAEAVQSQIDAIAEPSIVLIGYGLCGNGLLGIKSRAHTLIVPRTHDCVAVFLGSHQRYLQRFMQSPNTYYLTKGWLDAKDEPYSNYLGYVRDYDVESAEYIAQSLYGNYRKLCMIGFSQEELDGCRDAAKVVADFCTEHFGWEYEETVGSTELIEALLRMPARTGDAQDQFVVIKPGDEIAAEMFVRPGEIAPQPMARKGTDAS